MAVCMQVSKAKRSGNRTKAERDAWVARWRESGKSVRGFAAEHGLASSSLYQWLRASGSGAKERARGAAPKAAFAEVKVIGSTPAPASASASASCGMTLTVALRGGEAITFEGAQQLDPAWLAKVVEAVRAC